MNNILGIIILNVILRNDDHE